MITYYGYVTTHGKYGALANLDLTADVKYHRSYDKLDFVLSLIMSECKFKSWFSLNISCITSDGFVTDIRLYRIWRPAP